MICGFLNEINKVYDYWNTEQIHKSFSPYLTNIEIQTYGFGSLNRIWCFSNFQTLEKSERAIKTGQSRETDNIGCTGRRQAK